MKYIKYVCAVAFILTCIFYVFKQIEKPSDPKAVAGIFDLQEWNDFDKSVIKLDGTWRFQPNLFTHSMQNEVNPKDTDEIFMDVPSPWNKQHTGAVELMSNNGYGTYQLTILLPEEWSNKTVGLYIPSVATSYKLWVDNQNIVSNGTIATNESEMVPVNYARTVYFEPSRSTILLEMEVANFSQRKGGLWKSIQFGPADNIALLKEKSLAMQLLIVGALFVMGLYCLFIYYLRKSVLVTLYLGMLCFLLGTRTLLVEETFFVRLFPTFPWEIQVKLEYMPIVLGLYILVKYVHALYPKYKLPFIEKGITAISLLFAFFVLLAPAIVYTEYLFIFLIVICVGLIYFTYIFLKAYLNKQVGAFFSLFGFTVFIIAVYIDSLYFLDMIHIGSFSSLGFLFFLISQLFGHAVRFSEAKQQVDNLSQELVGINLSLDKKIAERTKELSAVNDRLQNAYSKLSKSEKDRKLLISDIAHELSRPMTLIKGYSEAIIDQKVPQEEKYVKIINTNAMMIERLIYDLTELSKLESREISIVLQEVYVNEYFHFIFRQFEWTVKNKGIHFSMNYYDEFIKNAPFGAFMYIDKDRINQVFMNIIDNAQKYTSNGKSISIGIEWVPLHHEENTIDAGIALQKGDILNDENKKVPEKKLIGQSIFTVRDEGEGIASEELPFIFNRLYRGKSNIAYDDETLNNRGLGLAISKEIIEIHGGSIWVKSKEGIGSTFYISLPTYIRT